LAVSNNKKFSSHFASGEESRFAKANKIIAILSDFTNLKNCNVLDIGTGSGHIAYKLGEICKKVNSINISDERMVKENYDFRIVVSEILPFENESFDLVISNQVIEHVPNQKLHIAEINRVLKNDGICYLATPNKFTIMEPHFKLPFLSYLPNKIANLYTNLFRKKDWDVYSLSRNKIFNLCKNNFETKEFTLNVLKNPEKYRLDGSKTKLNILNAIPNLFKKILMPIIPSFIFILKKKEGL